jgi:hypothetical protein
MFTARTSTPLSLVTLLLAALVVAGGALVPAGPAAAAPPDNDTSDSASVVTSLPFSAIVNIAEATDDVENLYCDGSIQTVWFSYTATADVTVAFNTVGSDYAAAIAVYRGAPDASQIVACDDASLGRAYSQEVIRVGAGQTYYVAVSRYLEGGDTLVFNAAEYPDSLIAHTELTEARLLENGNVALTFTVTCNAYATVQFRGVVTQRRGNRIVAEIPFNLDDDDEYCGPDPTSWTTRANYTPATTARPGKATIDLVTRAYVSVANGGLPEVFETQQFSVRLRKYSS